MIVASANIYEYARPMRRSRSGSAATESSSEFRRGLYIRLVSESGLEAWGEAAPLPGRSIESLDQARQAALGCIPNLREWPIPESGLALLKNVPASVIFALEQAAMTLCAREENESLATWLKRSSTERIRVNALLLDGGPDALSAAREAIEKGFTAFKLKVGQGSLSEEAERVHELRILTGRHAEIRLDANRAWGFDDTIRFLQRIEPCHVAYIEEPLADPALLPRLARESSVPIAVDESITERIASAAAGASSAAQADSRSEIWPESMARFIASSFSFAAVAVLKPTLLGGIRFSLNLARAFQKVEITPVISSSFETEVGLGGLFHVAAAVDRTGSAVGLDTLRIFESDFSAAHSDIEIGPTWTLQDDWTNRRPDLHHLKQLL